MQFQVLFSNRDDRAVYLDGILLRDGDHGQPATIIGERPTTGMLDLIVPATLDTWADELAVIDINERRGSLELVLDDTRVHLRPVAPA